MLGFWVAGLGLWVQVLYIVFRVELPSPSFKPGTVDTAPSTLEPQIRSCNPELEVLFFRAATVTGPGTQVFGIYVGLGVSGKAAQRFGVSCGVCGYMKCLGLYGGIQGLGLA